jgi:hypothetical protein
MTVEHIQLNALLMMQSRCEYSRTATAKAPHHVTERVMLTLICSESLGMWMLLALVDQCCYCYWY